MKKFKNYFAMVFLSMALLFTTSPIIAQTNGDDGDGGDKKLRKGTCWVDATPTCRKKKSGTVCDTVKRCSLKAYLDAAAKVVAIVAAVAALD